MYPPAGQPPQDANPADARLGHSQIAQVVAVGQDHGQGARLGRQGNRRRVTHEVASAVAAQDLHRRTPQTGHQQILVSVQILVVRQPFDGYRGQQGGQVRPVARAVVAEEQCHAQGRAVGDEEIQVLVAVQAAERDILGVAAGVEGLQEVPASCFPPKIIQHAALPAPAPDTSGTAGHLGGDQTIGLEVACEPVGLDEIAGLRLEQANVGRVRVANEQFRHQIAIFIEGNAGQGIAIAGHLSGQRIAPLRVLAIDG